jgi:predicted MFS family arabinose efflux permease
VAGAVIVVAFNLGVASGAAGGSVLHDRAGAGHLPVVGAILAAVASLGLAALAARGTPVTGRPETDLETRAEAVSAS